MFTFNFKKSKIRTLDMVILQLACYRFLNTLYIHKHIGRVYKVYTLFKNHSRFFNVCMSFQP